MNDPIRAFLPLALVLFTASAVGAPAPFPKPKPAISPATAKRVKQLRELPRDVWEIVWGPGRGQVSFLGWERSVEVLDADTFRPVRKIGPGLRLIHFTASADGGSLALAANSTRVEVRHLRAGKTVALETQNQQPGSAFSPDGKLVATGGYGTQAKLWDAATGRLIRSLDGGREGGLTVAFSPDGKLLAVGNRNGFTRLYEVATGKLLHTLPRRMSHELKFSPDGRLLAVAYVDGGVGLWKVADGGLLRLRETGAKETYSLDWSPRGDVLVSAGRSGKITLWGPRDLSVLKELEAPEWVIRVRFSPDGTRLLSAGGGISAGSERKAVVWGIDP